MQQHRTPRTRDQISVDVPYTAVPAMHYEVLEQIGGMGRRIVAAVEAPNEDNKAAEVMDAVSNIVELAPIQKRLDYAEDHGEAATIDGCPVLIANLAAEAISLYARTLEDCSRVDRNTPLVGLDTTAIRKDVERISQLIAVRAEALKGWSA